VDTHQDFEEINAYIFAIFLDLNSDPTGSFETTALLTKLHSIILAVSYLCYELNCLVFSLTLSMKFCICQSAFCWAK